MDTAQRTGGEAFLEALYEEHSAVLLAFVMSTMGGDLLAAEDIVQETMLRAWQHAGKVRAATAPRAWLFTVAHRLIIDRWRGRNARPREVADAVLWHMGVPDHAERSTTSVLVHTALTELNPKHRATLVELYLRDRTATEVAAVLGIPIGTVKSRLHGALHALRVALGEKGDPAGPGR
jgi:RNA polymerase sigma-70 factor (ECF subfamily)